MEDNAGYSQEQRIKLINERKFLTINGKKFSIPRRLYERIYCEKSEELSSSKLFYKDDGTLWARKVTKYRYKPTPLSRYASKALQDSLVSDYNEQFRPFRSEFPDEVVSSAVESVLRLEQNDLQNRKVFQSRLVRDFYKNSKF